MRSDLDQVMAARNLDALLVMGNSEGNTVMHYLTGRGHLERALIVKPRGGAMTLIHGGMERDTARDAALETGLALANRDERYNQYTLLEKHGGDQLVANVDYYAQVIRDFELSGRLGVYGLYDAGAAFALLTALQHHLREQGSQTEIVGEFGHSLFETLRQTKDDRELATMREVGERTGRVVDEVKKFIQRHAVNDDEIVIRDDGEALTIGDVKEFMRERFQAYELDDGGATIFSQGRDAGVPHNRGDAAMPLRLGQSIIFDIFPRGASGYYHDLTRTWSLGYATDEVQAAYAQCREIFERAVESVKVGQPCRDLQKMTCEFFEAHGHATTLSNPSTSEGYVHSLGHGLGLDIHETPRLSQSALADETLRPGHVVSVEPGLYYPERGFGVRVEDTVALNEGGELLTLSQADYDLVVPMPRWRGSQR